MKLNQNIFRFRKRNSQIQQKQNESEKLLRNFAFLDLKDLFDHFSVSGSGLTAKQAEQLQEEYGKNIITTGQSNTTLHRLVNAVVNPFNIVLLIIAVITLFTDVIYSQHGMHYPVFGNRLQPGRIYPGRTLQLGGGKAFEDDFQQGRRPA